MLSMILFIFGQENDIIKCKPQIKDGKYKIISEGKTISGEKRLLVFIYVKPKDINRQYLLQTPQRIKETYCNDPQLIAVIFDNKKTMYQYALSDYARTNGKVVRMRGFYSFDRKTGKDLLEFSTKRGDPTTEVQIDLSLQKHNL